MTSLFEHKPLGTRVTIDQLEVIDTPSHTDTWTPIPHSDVVHHAKESLNNIGLQVMEEAYGVTHKEQRFFGLLRVVDSLERQAEYSPVIGIRNSHDKTFPAAFCFGTGVYVCENLGFYAEIVMKRRHTKFINRDLPELVQRAIGRLHDMKIEQEHRIDTYKDTPVNDLQSHDLFVRGFRNDAISARILKPAVEIWHKPKHEEFEPRNAWSWFNSVTETMNKMSPHNLSRRTQGLHALVDNFTGLN